MIFGHYMKKDYPLCTAYLQTELPRMVFSGKVFEAFQKHGEMTEEEAKKALTLGEPPTLRPAFLEDAWGKYYGQGTPGLINDLFLSSTMLAWYEFSEANRNDVLMRQFLVITAMHEMVHWGDEKDGVDQAPEEGTAFEIEAFGKALPHYATWKQNSDIAFERRFPRAMK